MSKPDDDEEEEENEVQKTLTHLEHSQHWQLKDTKQLS